MMGSQGGGGGEGIKQAWSCLPGVRSVGLIMLAAGGRGAASGPAIPASMARSCASRAYSWLPPGDQPVSLRGDCLLGSPGSF